RLHIVKSTIECKTKCQIEPSRFHQPIATANLTLPFHNHMPSIHAALLFSYKAARIVRVPDDDSVTIAFQPPAGIVGGSRWRRGRNREVPGFVCFPRNRAIIDKLMCLQGKSKHHSEDDEPDQKTLACFRHTAYPVA